MPLGLLGGLDLFRELGERVTNSSPWGWFFSRPCSALGYPRRHWFTRTRWLARPEGKDLPKVGWQQVDSSSSCSLLMAVLYARKSNQVFHVFLLFPSMYILSISTWFPFPDIFYIHYFDQNLEIFIKSQSSNTSFWMFSRHNPKRNLDSYESKFKYYDNLQSSPSNVCRLFF